jgi:hypothetical protein
MRNRSMKNYESEPYFQTSEKVVFNASQFFFLPTSSPPPPRPLSFPGLFLFDHTEVPCPTPSQIIFHCFHGTPTKRQVSKRQVSKRLVSKTSGFKTSGLQNVRFTKRQVSKRLVSKRPVFKFDIVIKQKVWELLSLHPYLK